MIQLLKVFAFALATVGMHNPSVAMQLQNSLSQQVVAAPAVLGAAVSADQTTEEAAVSQQTTDASTQTAADTSTSQSSAGSTTTAQQGTQTANTNQLTQQQIKDLINQEFNTLIAQGKLTGPAGPAGAKGDRGDTGAAYTPNPNPISYYTPQAPSTNEGGSMSGISNLSAASSNVDVGLHPKRN